MKLSKKVKHGTLVVKRGDKYILCAHNRKPVGVYQRGSTFTMITDEGRMVFNIPKGIVTQGPATVLVAGEDNKQANVYLRS